MRPTQKEVKRLFCFNSETGELIRRVTVAHNAKKGDVAGTLYGGYRRVWISGRNYEASRLIWLWVYGVWPSHDLDHINHNTLDNRLKNLREVTNLENKQNGTLYKNNTSGHVGVSKYNGGPKWVSYIYVNEQQITLGSFDTFEEAVAARKRAEVRYGFHKNNGKAKPALD